MSEVSEYIDEILAINEDALITYGKYVETLPTEYYRTSLILIWREAIEVADGIKSLVTLSSCNPIPILLRSIFELYLGISFIFSDNSKIKQRALAYGGVNIIRRIENYKKYDPNNPEYIDFKACLGSDIIATVHSDNFDYKAAVDNLSSIFSKYPEYQQFKQEFDSIAQKRKRKEGLPAWYELYDGCSSIFSLSDRLGLKKYYVTLYDDFSKKGHGYGAMDAWEPDHLKNPKIPDLKKLANNIDLLLSFMTGIARNILANEYPKALNSYGKAHLALRDKGKQLSSQLNNISYVEKDICEN